MPARRSTLLVYNTADRLLRGDLFHTVTTEDVLRDLAAFPPAWPIVGVGTTNWLQRNGEVIPDGTVGEPRFLWTDPDSDPLGRILNVCYTTPADEGAMLVTPRVDSNDQQANFPFLVVAVCDPAAALMWTVSDMPNLHPWLIDELAQRNVGVAGIQVRARCRQVKTTDAYNVPLGGLDLSKGYVGEQHFRFGDYGESEWVFNGAYTANPSLHPFISVPGVPLHLHGYRPNEADGGHIVLADVIEASVTVWPLDEFVMKISDVARAMNPVKNA